MLAQVGGGGQSLVLQPLWVQLIIWQVVEDSQDGHSEHEVQVWSLQLRPAQVALTQLSTHLPWVAQVGQSPVVQPRLVQLVIEHWRVAVQRG